MERTCSSLRLGGSHALAGQQVARTLVKRQTQSSCARAHLGALATLGGHQARSKASPCRRKGRAKAQATGWAWARTCRPGTTRPWGSPCRACTHLPAARRAGRGGLLHDADAAVVADQHFSVFALQMRWAVRESVLTKQMRQRILRFAPTRRTLEIRISDGTHLQLVAAWADHMHLQWHRSRALWSSDKRKAAVRGLTLVHSPPSGPSGAQQGQSLSPQGAGEGAGDGLGMGSHLPPWHHSPLGQSLSRLHSSTGGDGLGEGDSSTTQTPPSLQTSTSPSLPCRCAGQ